MKELLQNINIIVNSNLFIKEPFSSELGQSIVYEGSIMISELGIEQFTFKKLAEKICTTESSIYRYFENKYQLLIFLVSWYYKFLEYILVFSISNISEPKDKLRFCVKILTKTEDDVSDKLNLVSLQKILIYESNKAMLYRNLNEQENENYFEAYNKLCERISRIILEINSEYKYSKSLSSLLLEGIYHQKYITEKNNCLSETRTNDEIEEFYFNLIYNTIRV